MGGHQQGSRGVHPEAEDVRVPFQDPQRFEGPRRERPEVDPAAVIGTGKQRAVAGEGRLGLAVVAADQERS